MCLDVTIKSCNLVVLCSTWSSHMSLCCTLTVACECLTLRSESVENFGVSHGKSFAGLGFLGCYLVPCALYWAPFVFGEASIWDDCLLGSLRYVACGISEHFALQEALGSLSRMFCEPSSC